MAAAGDIVQHNSFFWHFWRGFEKSPLRWPLARQLRAMVVFNSNQGGFSMPMVRLVRSGFLGAAVVGSLLVSASLAMSADHPPQQALPFAPMQSLLANPDGLLSQYPNGGALMISRVKDLVASDPATVNPILALLKTANSEQASAIGTALGQVAMMAVA